MCGIAGIIARRQGVDLQNRLAAMVDSLSHRGPNGTGLTLHTTATWELGLAHTRLAILDLSEAGCQPMVGARQKCWMTYNGEVYNFQELREELRRQHETFHSGTDSEVILRAYECWGLAAVARLRGMFSLGLWDEAAGRVILARDVFGIKPLYYYHTPDLFVFASEIRTLLASGLVPRRLSHTGLASYLQAGSVEAPDTIIAGVRAVLPGQYLVIDLTQPVLQPQATEYGAEVFPDTALAAEANRQEAVMELRHLLAESVRLHLVSDVPLGVFLSGGIDSSALVALMSQVATERPKTFSVVFAEKQFSEASYAQLIADRYGTEHQEILLTEAGLLPCVPHALRAMDQPSVDGVNTFIISKAVKEAGITVALSGLGGDELFAGYPSFQRARDVHRIAGLPQPLRKTMAAAGHVLGSRSVSQQKFWELFGCDGRPETAYAISRRLFSPDESQALLHAALLQPVHPATMARPLRLSPPDIVNTVSQCELRGYMANTLLRDTDSMSMAHALEVRVPFVDKVVVQHVLTLPGAWKIDKQRPKPLLLDALQDLLPEQLWRRPKMGFTLPFAHWMRGALSPGLEEAFRQEKSWQALGLTATAVRQRWQAFRHNPQRERWARPWALYVLHEWCLLHQVTL